MGDVMYSVGEQRTPRHPPAKGARPDAIRAALQSDPERFTRVVRRAAAISTGHEPPGDASLTALRTEAGM